MYFHTQISIFHNFWIDFRPKMSLVILSFLLDMKWDEKHSFMVIVNRQKNSSTTIKYRGKKPSFYFHFLFRQKKNLARSWRWIENSFFISFFSSFFFSFNCHCRRHLPSLKRDKKRDVPFLTSDNRHFCAKGPNKLFLFIKISKFRPRLDVLIIICISETLCCF